MPFQRTRTAFEPRAASALYHGYRTDEIPPTVSLIAPIAPAYTRFVVVVRRKCSRWLCLDFFEELAVSPLIGRREFLQVSAGACLASLTMNHPRAAAGENEKRSPLYTISLAEYSLHRMLEKGELDHLDFAQYTVKNFGIDALEYWNSPFADKGADKDYIAEMKKRADDAGAESLLIMIDNEGRLGDPDETRRKQAVENHHKWVEAAKSLGCHSIRVNAYSEGSYDEQMKLVVDGLGQLSRFAADHEINIIVENHGGLSSNGEWLSSVMKQVDLENCGTLPDFGNFDDYDRYKAIREMMPWAKAVSAKSHDFDDEGNETETDYVKMMQIVVDAGYHGRVGIEYEGRRLSEPEGVRATKKLLERVRDQLSA
jgi:sugar phosphate isomerase/epimerase